MNVVTLSDYHRQEIQDINQDKETILQRYKEKKQGILSICSFIFENNSNRVFMSTNNTILRIVCVDLYFYMHRIYVVITS